MPRDYDNFSYIYPPRPEISAPPSHLKIVEGTHWGQPKLNGSYGVLATNINELFFMNRHKKSFSNKLLISDNELKSMHRGEGWIYLCGEYMNKSKKGADGKIFNGKFVIFDILVYENVWLTSTTFEYRQSILDNIFSVTEYDGFIDRISLNCFRAKNFKNNLLEVYEKLIEIDMYEGEVPKRPEGKLETSFKPTNNGGWQLKIRKPTKNYSF